MSRDALMYVSARTIVSPKCGLTCACPPSERVPVNPNIAVDQTPASAPKFSFVKTLTLAITLAASLAAQAAAQNQPCSLAIFTHQLPPTNNVCDAKAVAALANQGRVYEQNQMGLASMLVLGSDADMPKAVAWFQKAAQGGYVPAQVNLAVLYINGWGVPQNLGAAVQWLHRAADAHSAAAYFNLGELYFKGQGVHQDYGEALRLFRLGAESGNTYAQTNLAYLYDRGLGVPRDLAAAAGWYRKAANAGNAMAESNLADMYERGEGVPRDPAMAFHLYQQAAEKGHTGAQIQLAYRLAQGIVAPKDLAAALTWVSAATLAGDNRGQELLQALQTELSPEQKKRAHDSAEQLRATTALAGKSAVLQP